MRSEGLRALEARFGLSLFARGFLLSESDPRFIPAGWREVALHKTRLWTHPWTPVEWRRTDAGELVLGGHAVDHDEPALSNGAIADRLLASLTEPPQRLHELTDNLNGRWFLLHRRTGASGWRLAADATGMRSVFHHADGGTAGSHARLVAENVAATWQERDRSRFGYPGRRTPYSEVLLLPPNQELDLSTGQLHRTYPRASLAPRTVEVAATEALQLMRSCFAGLLERFASPVVSLTAGIDSRLTLAASREVSDRLRFFTYYRGDDVQTDLADRAVAEHLAARLGLDHRTLHLDSADEQFLQLCEAHSYYRHLPRAARRYVQEFDPSSDAHVRSNLSEIGRCFYRSTKNVTAEPATGEDLASIYLRFSRQEVTPAARQRIVEDFTDLHRVTRFAAAARLRSGRDLLYWEHRMGAWHALAVLESDPAFESFSLFNSRRLLDVLLSVPEEERVRASVFHRIIAQGWPEVARVPINPRKDEAALLRDGHAPTGGPAGRMRRRWHRWRRRERD